MINLVCVYQQIGQMQQVNEFFDQFEKINCMNFFFYVYCGDFVFVNGDMKSVLQYMKCVYQIDVEFFEVYVGFVKVYLVFGSFFEVCYYVGCVL